MEKNYRISTGGRVKAAGLSYGTMFGDASEPFINNPSIRTAKAMTNYYAFLRKSPSDGIRDRFFPRDGETVGMLKNGAALPRTSITTHQGVGQFLVHNLKMNITNEKPLKFEIANQTGFCILEAHLDKKLQEASFPQEMMALIKDIKGKFSLNNLKEAQLAYEKLIIAGKSHGIDVKRVAQVGREGLLFIHPSVPKNPINIDSSTHRRLSESGNLLADRLTEIAKEKRNILAKQLSIMPAIPKRNFPPLFFQTDFLVTNDGRIQISDFHLPDVGFFLTTINHENNQTVKAAQQTVEPLLPIIAQSIVDLAISSNSKTINLITRKAVIENLEDTLEIKEIQAISYFLEQSGYKPRVISLDQSLKLGNQDLGILMNIDTKSQVFSQLIINRISDESVPIYPDPFILLAKNELTDHQQTFLNQENLVTLREAFISVERASNPVKDYVLTSAINQMFHDFGLPDDCAVFHMYIDGQPTPIPFHRYDIRGLRIALNYAKNSQSVIIRSIPINDSNSILFDQDGGPIYSVLRYMFYQ